MTPVRFRELQALPEHTGPGRRLLLCRECDEETSASPRDYFNVSPEHIFECCNKPVSLVVKKTVYVEVSRQ